jgi:hypothetical protein
MPSLCGRGLADRSVTQSAAKTLPGTFSSRLRTVSVD